jgi:hypothetical protein
MQTYAHASLPRLVDLVLYESQMIPEKRGTINASGEGDGVAT